MFDNTSNVQEIAPDTFEPYKTYKIKFWAEKSGVFTLEDEIMIIVIDNGKTYLITIVIIVL